MLTDPDLDTLFIYPFEYEWSMKVERKGALDWQDFSGFQDLFTLSDHFDNDN